MKLFDQGWEKLREQIFANQKRLGVIPANTQLTPVAGQPAEVGLAVGGAEKDRHPPGRRVRRLHRLQRPRDRARDPGGRGHGQARQHADHLHQRRQRHEFRGLDDGHAEHDDRLQRRARTARTRVPALLRILGLGRHLPAHGGAMGLGLRHAVQVGQAGRFALRRHPPGHGDLLAGPHRRRRRHPYPVSPRDRHRADDPRSRRHPCARHGRRHQAEADGRRQHGLHFQEGQRERAVEAHDAVLRDLRQPRHLQGRLVRGDDAARAALARRHEAVAAGGRTTSGSSTTSPRTSRRPTTWLRRCPTSSRRCRRRSLPRRTSTRSSRSTTRCCRAC
jgi:hypothetical protein